MRIIDILKMTSFKLCIDGIGVDSALVSGLFKDSLFRNDVSVLFGGTAHSCHLHVVFHFRKRETQIHPADSHPGTAFGRPGHWGHLYGRENKNNASYLLQI